ncbi:hypothetical protein BDV97DRAFT_155349 [Delphinella strobiligena]|nr:hypothetical protein BDV97DRAFT_155349 [Delphinella strobiligena]
MRSLPGPDASSSISPRTKTRKPNRQRSDNSTFENSLGYRLATEGSRSTTDMGANGALQIWPKVSSQTYQHLPDDAQKKPCAYHRSFSENLTRSRDDVLTPHSYQDTASRRQLLQPVSRRPTIHAAISHPDFHSKRQDEINQVPRGSQQTTRSHRLGLSRLFGRDKEVKNKAKFDSRIKELEQHETDVHHVSAHVKPVEPSTKSTIQRSQKTTFDRNATENAKIHVRRPPKGVKHWFDALDDSDDCDFPEVVQAPPEHVTTATFRPSLGPGRLRVAPTSRISPAVDAVQDPFMFKSVNGQSLQEQSVLNLESSDEDELSEPPSPDRWPEQHLNVQRPELQRNKSTDTRESVFSMMTTMTSGSIPIINADSLYRTPLPPLPAPLQHQHSSLDTAHLPAPLRTHRPEVNVTRSRSRAATGHSHTDSIVSAISGASDSTTRVMTVTQEEMALLEMMRRKRAEMHNSNGSAQPAHRQDDVSPVSSRPTHAFERQNSHARSIASSTISRDSERSVLGTVFPAPPTADRRSKQSQLSRGISEEKILAHPHGDEFERTQHATPAKPVSEIPIMFELDATPPSGNKPADDQLLPSVSYSQPTQKGSPQAQAQKTKISPPSYDSADPYQLAPDLDFSTLDLLPLPPRAYSPCPSTSRSSLGGGSSSSALTPTDGNSATSRAQALEVVGHGESHAQDFLCELDVKRNSRLDMGPAGAGNDVLAAWTALGGV